MRNSQSLRWCRRNSQTGRGTRTRPESPPLRPEGDAADADDAEGGGAEETLEEQPPPPPMRPVALTSQDYVKRLPAPKFQEWKDIETQVLALKDKPGGTIRPYVVCVCAGVPYGNGEDAFLGLFKSAWQSRPTLRVIGEGKNYIPMVHARDVARLTRHLLEVSPSLDYHVAVDRGDVTQKTLIQAVAKQFALPYDPAPVTVAEALLAELADILTINLRFEPSSLMEVPWEAPPPAEEVEEEGKETEAADEAKALEVPDQSSALNPPDAAKKTRPTSQATEKLSLPPTSAGVDIETMAEEPGPPIEVPPPGFRWWCETGIVENMSKVASEFCLWRQLVPVKLALVGPSGNGSGEFCHRLAEMYNVPALVLDELIQDFVTRESPLGLQIKEQRDLIAANAANPKSQGPFTMPGQLVAKVMSTALAEKPGTHRGWIMSGFPRTLEETLAFFTDAPPTPAEPPKKGKEVEAVNLDELKYKDDFKPDVMVLVNSAREVCQARLESGDFSEKEFQTGMDQWSKDMQQIQEIFTKHLGTAEATVSSDQAAEAERQKHEAEVKSAEEEEREAPAAPDEKDLVVLASSTWAWVDAATSSVSQTVQELHPICNFLPPPNDPLASQQASKAESGEGTEGQQIPVAEAPNEEKLRQDQRVENVKKEELARLEKHSELCGCI